MRERPDLKAKTRFKKAVMTAVGAVVPSGAIDSKLEYVVESYTETYNCCPPPLFIIIISAVEVCVCMSVPVSMSVLLFIRAVIHRHSSTRMESLIQLALLLMPY